MQKYFTVAIDGKQQLVKYKRSGGSSGDTLFFVETNIPALPKFQFSIRDGKASYDTINEELNITTAEIISNIKLNESKK